MKNFNSFKNKFLFVFLLVSYIFIPTTQALTLEEAGLTPEDVRFLSPSELKEILNPSKSNIPTEQFFPALSADLGPLPNTVSCFDYYTFGSVEVNISSGVSTTVAGTPITFSGLINNKNKYPVVDGTLYVKIFKLDKSPEKNADGPDLVDQFVAVDNVSIKGSSYIPFKFDWNIPQYAESSKYKVATFFTSADKFNLLGLSFTDDIIGNSFNFSVEGKKDTVRFNKHTVKINNNEYHFAAYPPRIDKKVDARIEAELVNTTNKAQNIPVNWKVYSWDAQHADNLIQDLGDIVTVPANSKKTLSFLVRDTAHLVYYVVAESNYMGTKSILGMRFVREGVDKMRINFPSVTEYPLTKGQENTVFSCLHGMGTADLIEGGKLVLTLRDDQNDVIHQYGYLGPVSGAMMGVKDTFVPKENYNNFILSAELYQNTKLVDSAVMKYDCKSIDPDLCPPSTTTIPVGQTSIIIIVLIVIIILALLVYKRMRLPTMILFLMLLGTGFSLAPLDVEAKDVQWNTVEGSFAYRGMNGDWYLALTDVNIKVTYHAKIEKADTGEVINDGAMLPVGTELILSFIPHVYTDIDWNGVGHSLDTPHGEWRKDAAPPAVSCDEKDYVNNDSVYRGIRVYIPLVISPPTKQITNLDGLTCGPLQGDSMRCTVSRSGAFSPTFNFNATTGRFFYRYTQDKCYGNNVPLRQKKGQLYTLQVPPQTISYNFTGGVANQNPTTPIITGPIQGLTDQSQTFSVRSTDADLDQLKYGIDWNSDSSVDQWIPSTGFVDQNVAQSFPKAWSSVGSYTFKAMAQDSKGATSGWASHTIVITAVPDLVAGSVTPATAARNVSQTYTATISNIGNASTGASFSYFFQKNTKPGDTDTIVDLTSASTVALSNVGGSNTVVVTSPSISFLNAGQVRLCADQTSSSNAGVIAESNETNNCGPWTDVVVSSCSIGDITISRRASFNTADLSIPVFISGSSNWYILNRNGAEVDRTNVSDTILDVNVPAGNHTYQLVDRTTGVACGASKSFNLPATDSPDLVAGSVTPDTAGLNEPRTFVATISNYGAAPVLAGTTVNHIFQFDGDTNHDIVDTTKKVSTTGAISVSFSPTISTSHTFTTAGVKYARVCTDADERGPSDTGATGTIAESTENNNCGVWTVVTVGGGITNQPPVVQVVIKNRTIKPGETDSISMPTIVTDPDSSTLNTVWTKFSGPSRNLSVISPVNETNSSNARPHIFRPRANFTQLWAFPSNTTTDTVYVFRLTATDDSGATGYDDFTVTVLPPDIDPPTIDGECSNPPKHYTCSSTSPEASTNHLSSPSKWTWTCPGTRPNGKDATCTEKKSPGFKED